MSVSIQNEPGGEVAGHATVGEPSQNGAGFRLVCKVFLADEYMEILDRNAEGFVIGSRIQ